MSADDDFEIPGVFYLIPLVMFLAALGFIGMETHSLILIGLGCLSFVPAFYYLFKAATIR